MAADFHEISLPDDFAKGASGGPGFHTTVLILSGGAEKRNVDWQDARGTWTVGFGLRDISLVQRLIVFHRARYGRAFGFRMTDWMDYQLPFPGDDPVTLGTGDGSLKDFQLIKPYTDEGGTYVRPIQKPTDNGTIRISVDGVAKSEGSDYTVDYTSGNVHFGTAPALHKDVTVTYCEFQVPVRFDDDDMQVALETVRSGSWDGVKLVEVPVDNG